MGKPLKATFVNPIASVGLKNFEGFARKIATLTILGHYRIRYLHS